MAFDYLVLKRNGKGWGGYGFFLCRLAVAVVVVVWLLVPSPTRSWDNGKRQRNNIEKFIFGLRFFLCFSIFCAPFFIIITLKGKLFRAWRSEWKETLLQSRCLSRRKKKSFDCHCWHACVCVSRSVCIHWGNWQQFRKSISPLNRPLRPPLAKWFCGRLLFLIIILIFILINAFSVHGTVWTYRTAAHRFLRKSSTISFVCRLVYDPSCFLRAHTRTQSSSIADVTI